MPAHKVKLEIDQGATFDKTFTWLVGAPRNAVAVDLTDCTARAQVRADIDSPDVLLQLTTENRRILLGGATGEIRLHIDAATTSAIDWESGVYDLEIQFPNGTVVRRMAGSVIVSREVTRGIVIDVDGHIVGAGLSLPYSGGVIDA